MGMFDTVYCSFTEAGEDFAGENQTKSFDKTLMDYWLSPNGELFEISRGQAWDLEIKEIGQDTPPWGSFQWIPTGENERLRPYLFHGVAVIYPANFKGPYHEWPDLTLVFNRGKVETYHVTTKANGRVL